MYVIAPPKQHTTHTTHTPNTKHATHTDTESVGPQILTTLSVGHSTPLAEQVWATPRRSGGPTQDTPNFLAQ